jgi:hypothetical protein
VNIEVEALRKKSSHEGRRINALESERAHLKLRLADRDAELKGKAKLLEVGCFYICIGFPVTEVGEGKWLI